MGLRVLLFSFTIIGLIYNYSNFPTDFIPKIIPMRLSITGNIASRMIISLLSEFLYERNFSEFSGEVICMVKMITSRCVYLKYNAYRLLSTMSTGNACLLVNRHSNNLSMNTLLCMRSNCHEATTLTNCNSEVVPHSAAECYFFHDALKDCNRKDIKSSYSVCLNFVKEHEAQNLLKEVEPHLQRLRYEYNHWDDVSICF